MGKYRFDIDLLKGLAILAVVLYHAGWCKSGYLGVDIFFVLSGYLTVPRVIGEIEAGSFRYLGFLEKRLFRLLPLVLVVSAFSLLVGYWGMLPGDLRFLSEEVLAASLFGNNVLQAVTTQNYWAAIYHKVLMHTWFLGILFQFYVAFPILMLLTSRRMRLALMVLTFLSLVLYLLPVDSIGNKYYLLPYRLFEITIGGIVGMKDWRKSELGSYASLALMIFMIFLGAFMIGGREMPYNLVGGTNTIRESFLPREALVLLTVWSTASFLAANGISGMLSRLAECSKVLAPMGRMSLGIFLLHQPLFAFYRYFYADEISCAVLLADIGLTILLAYLYDTFVESRLQVSFQSRAFLLLAFIAVDGFALWIYSQGGAVRDVPELDIKKETYDPTVFERYTDRIYQYDHEFEKSDTSKIKVLVVGNSFARDFANILLESCDSDRIQLSYHYGISDCPLSRIRLCDRLCFFGWKHDVPERVWQCLRPTAEVWGIGTKNHGTSNGIFYKNRYHSDYFSQATPIRQDLHTVNRLLQEEWGEHYYDLLHLTLQPDNTVPVFTPDHHFITYDGLHLTPAGTRYYALLLMSSAGR